MKNVLLAASIALTVTGVLAQGTIQFNNSTAGALTKVYMPDGNSSYSGPMLGLPKNGNTATDSVAGTQTYTGALLQGPFTAELWAATGSVPESGLAFSGATTTFRTGSGAGRLAVATATLNNVPKDAALASFQIRVFPTSYGSYANAFAAFNSGTDSLAWVGKSIVFQVANIGGDVNTPPAMTTLTSFSLGGVPEPSTTALTTLSFLMLTARKRTLKA